MVALTTKVILQVPNVQLSYFTDDGSLQVRKFFVDHGAGLPCVWLCGYHVVSAMSFCKQANRLGRPHSGLAGKNVPCTVHV